MMISGMKQIRDRHILVVGLIGIVIGVVFYSADQDFYNECRNTEKTRQQDALIVEVNLEANESVIHKVPKFWFHNVDYDFSIFEQTATVLKRLGLKEIQMSYSTNAKDFVHMDWDLVWSYNYYTMIPIDWENLRPHQKINHFPGSFALVSKSHLSTMIPSRSIPRGFRTVEALKDYSAAHPGKRFVEKSKMNRGVSIKNVTEMNFVDDHPYQGFFAQEYVENPMLIEGHKFDFSNYVLITSVNPLRIYLYSKHTVLRICNLPYDAHDISDMDRHVIGETHIASLDFEPIKKFTDLGYTPKQGLIAIMKARGLDHEKLYRDLETIISETVIEREKYFVNDVG